ncbi:MAG: cellobiose phosphorylase [Candidatus Margulisiibacteriota bacterium]
MAVPRYYLADSGEFVIENYNLAPTFSSFFPGIAGLFGCPMWVFYANRGQCITSMGVQDKDGAILEFQPANKAYRTVALQGFRTFIKVDGKFYEPFSEQSPYPNKMIISPAGLKLVEENPKLKIKVEVNYFNIVNQSFPGLARTVTITNLDSKKKEIEIVDGLPVMIPAGFGNDLLKKICQTIEAWCLTENLEKDVPFFRLKVMPSDEAKTKLNEKGNFYTTLALQGKKQVPVYYVVNPTCIFGENSSLESPKAFIKNKTFQCPIGQQTEGCMPSAFSLVIADLKAKESIKINSLFGQAESSAAAIKIREKTAKGDYFEQKSCENKQLIDNLCSAINTQSASPAFDQYTRQTFLDNVMRGGTPIDLGGKIIYVYYRKHGDMERDYNDFRLMPTYFSQGNGNYRDVNQNRRNDIFFNPNLAEDNIVRFFNLIQLDGFNPLIVLGSQFRIKSTAEAEALLSTHIKNPLPELVGKITNAFLLGNLLKDFEQLGIKYSTSVQKFASDLISQATMHDEAQHGEGFWIDHPYYNTDLLESYECIYPDKILELLFSKKVFTFYDNDHSVAGRSEKYSQLNNKILQFESVRFDPTKAAIINSRPYDKNRVRTDFGKGTVYKTTLMAKIIGLIACKAASFDAEGIGLEMEADKPDWYDALNGLPGLFGSSLSETLELKRLCHYVTGYLTEGKDVSLPIEVNDFVVKLHEKLTILDNFKYWDAANDLKEDYREKIKLGVSGEETAVSRKLLAAFAQSVANKCSAGIKKCLSKYNNYYTYFINEVIKFDASSEHKISIQQFKQTPLPLFLEGFVHALKVEQDRKIYNLVKSSPLYDEHLKMYKVNSPLKDAPLEIGRARVFTPGWLENESIWLHMEYKYLLELLKAGMYAEFFKDFKDTLVPFMDPKTYKRNILENSSFIVSSANPNLENHGRGFVARLSGGAAEFIDMWLIMTCGKKIFSLNANGKIYFKLSPILPSWLFNQKGEFSFNLLGTIPVTYINKKQKDSFAPGTAVSSYQLTFSDGKKITIDGSIINDPQASLIRSRKIKKIVATIS